MALLLAILTVGGVALAASRRAAPKASSPAGPARQAVPPSKRHASSSGSPLFANVTAGTLAEVSPGTAAAIQTYILNKQTGLALTALRAIPIVGVILAALLELDLSAATAQRNAAMAKLEAQLPARIAEAKYQLAHGDTAQTTASVQASIPADSVVGSRNATTAYKTAERQKTATAEKTGNYTDTGVIARPPIKTRNLQLLE